jgi:photosystem II stability/assembly factor-like uncharacterized protein
VNPATTDAVVRGLLCLRRGAGKQNKGGAAMVSRLSRLRVLSVLLPLVLVAPPLGGRLSDRAADAAASSQISGTLIDLHGVACPSPSTCVAVGGDTILRSTDGGRTWRRQPNPLSGTPYGLYGVACPSPSTCVAVGADCPNASTCVACPSPSPSNRPVLCGARETSGTILRSTDGGRTWRRQPSGTPNILLWGVACVSPSTCVAVGDKGTILRSTDGGRTWRSQHLDLVAARYALDPISGTLYNLIGVVCPSPSTCVAVGGSGAIVRSTDGGRTWRSV